MRAIEERLGHSMRGGAARSGGNAALDILTGRGADQRYEPAPAPTPVMDHTAVAVAGQASMLYLRSKTAVRPMAPRYRIERPLPPPRRSRFRPLIPYAVAAAVVAAAVIGWRWSHPATNAETPVEAAAQIAEPQPQPQPTAVPTQAAVVVARAPVAAPTLQPTVAPPPAAVPVPASELRMLLDEAYAPGPQAWPGAPDATVWRGNGAFRLRASQPEHFVAVGIPGTSNLTDAIVTASFHKMDGPAGGGYGLILRDQGPGPRDGLNQDGRFYVFEAGDQGKFGIWLRELDHWVDLLTWTPSGAIHQGTGSNELTVTATGDTMSFLINGIPVASQVDPLLHHGAVSLFTGGDGNEVAVEHITVRVPR
jgi:hypothetical protein